VKKHVLQVFSPEEPQISNKSPQEEFTLKQSLEFQIHGENDKHSTNKWILQVFEIRIFLV
jgi:hypothetical protein